MTTADVDHIVAWGTVILCSPFVVVAPVCAVVIYVDRRRMVRRNLRLQEARRRRQS